MDFWDITKAFVHNTEFRKINLSAMVELGAQSPWQGTNFWFQEV